jgi:Adenylosuccinate synthetase
MLAAAHGHVFTKQPSVAASSTQVTVVLGAQWSDEGKGKLVDILSADVDICARFAGGNNANHTIIVSIGPERVQTTFAFHLLPSGALPFFLTSPSSFHPSQK